MLTARVVTARCMRSCNSTIAATMVLVGMPTVLPLRTFVGVFLGHRADLNSRSDAGWTPLFAAVSRGQTNVIAELLANKAEVNVRDHSGTTLLQYVIQHSDVIPANKAIVDLLRQHGAKE